MYNETNTLLSNAVLNPFLYTLNIGYWLKVYKRKKALKEGDKCALTQGQANKLWENPAFPIQTVSAALINTIWFSFFYATAIPIGILFAFVSLLYEYWILKVENLKLNDNLNIFSGFY